MRMRFLAVLLALFALLAAACGASTSADLTDGDEPPASADDSLSPDDDGEPTDGDGGQADGDGEPADDGDETETLPGPVAELREEILAAAHADDYKRLAELGLEGRFTASFGGEYEAPEELTEYWRREDANEGPDMDEVLIGLLGLAPYTTPAQSEDGQEVTIYVWPRAQSEDATDADRRDLEDLFGEETIEFWYADGTYLGWRLGITAEGDWQFFVAGD